MKLVVDKRDFGFLGGFTELPTHVGETKGEGTCVELSNLKRIKEKVIR